MCFRFAFTLFCILCFLSGNKLMGQTLVYDILKGDDRIGEIIVEKEIRGNKTHIEANSEASFRVLFKNDLSTHTSADFVNDKLEYAMSKIILNGKIREHAITRKENDTYTFFKHPDQTIKKKVSPYPLSSVALYYAEPRGVRQVFSENYQEMCELKAIGNGTYELLLPGGKINQYVYENGKLIEIKVFRTFVDLIFRLKDHG